MADDLHYVPGDFYRICDKSGFKVRAKRTSMEWNGLIVSHRFFEARQPQDFVRGVQDNQTVPYPRPRQVNQFLGALTTTLTANVGAGGSHLAVASSTRMFTGDSMSVMLDNGTQFSCSISGVPDAASINVSPALPSAASSGSLVIDNSAVSPASIG